MTDFASVAVGDEKLEKVYLSKKAIKEEPKIGASITTDQTSLFNGNSKMVMQGSNDKKFMMTQSKT